MTTINKLLGTFACAIGAALLYLEYIVICAIGALGAWIADFVGATGGAHTGIMLLAYVPVIGLIVLILVGAMSAFAFGISYLVS